MTATPITSAPHALSYMLAGNAVVTLRSRLSGHRYTYHVKKSADGNLWFVRLRVSSDEEQYIGLVTHDHHFKVTAKSQLSPETKPVKAISWTLKHLTHHNVPDDLEIWHEGHCGKCNRPLTDPESIARGLGPTCAEIA